MPSIDCLHSTCFDCQSCTILSSHVEGPPHVHTCAAEVSLFGIPNTSQVNFVSLTFDIAAHGHWCPKGTAKCRIQLSGQWMNADR